MVAAAGADREPTHVVSVDLANRLYPYIEFMGFDSGYWTGDVRKLVYVYWLQLRLPLCGLDNLAVLCELYFKDIFRDGAVFGGVGEGDCRPGRKVASVDGCKPRGLYRKSCCSVEVADEGSNDGQVMGIQGGGRGAPLRWGRWMRLEKEREAPKFGAGEFAPTAKDDHVVLVEHSDGGFFK